MADVLCECCGACCQCCIGCTSNSNLMSNCFIFGLPCDNCFNCKSNKEKGYHTVNKEDGEIFIPTLKEMDRKIIF